MSMKQTKLLVKTDTQKYPMIIGSNLTTKIPKIIKKNSISFNQCFIVVDKNVPKKLVSNIKNSLKNYETYIHIFNANEKNKDFKNVNKILKILLERNFTREDCLISVGGGITGDISGFAASIFKRGIKFLNIPTTLLSQVDSSIGGKTGINSNYGKNLIGSFYQPCLVIADINFLKSLPDREIICGYGEILKHSLIDSKKFFTFLNRNLKQILNLTSPFMEKAIYQSCKVKMKIVKEDEKEKGLRKILNFGHTFAHAYEASLGYSRKLNHGEAVILGMKTAIYFSYKEKFLKKTEYKEIMSHFKNSRLHISLSEFFKTKDIKKVVSFMMKDKKNVTSDINLVLLKDIGKPIFNKNYKRKKIEIFIKNYLRN